MLVGGCSGGAPRGSPRPDLKTRLLPILLSHPLHPPTRLTPDSWGPLRCRSPIDSLALNLNLGVRWDDNQRRIVPSPRRIADQTMQVHFPSFLHSEKEPLILGCLIFFDRSLDVECMHFLPEKDVPFRLTDHRMIGISPATIGVTRPAEETGSHTSAGATFHYEKGPNILPVFSDLYFSSWTPAVQLCRINYAQKSEEDAQKTVKLTRCFQLAANFCQMKNLQT